MMYLLGRVMVWMRHLACGLTGAIAFGLVAYFLDIGGIKSAAQPAYGLENPLIIGGAMLVGVFAILDILMQRLMGGPGSL